ncbi:MAG: hypothetical protein E6I99_01085 [Chloroflexi bacterium]|nr:MAG: hypothetical protein E6I99_01085 [Chloroflexota bacterium]
MDIVGRRNWYFLLSLAIILPGIISMLFFGFRLGIDFAGGDQFNIAFKQPTSAAAVQKEMDTFNVEATVQQAGPNNVLITTKPLGTTQETAIRDDLNKKFGGTVASRASGSITNSRSVPSSHSYMMSSC